MATEDPLFHGKHTATGKRVLEYPTYHICREGRYWNVICSAFGNSGYLATHEAALDWVERHIRNYVRIEDYLALEQENRMLKEKLAKLELTAVEHTGD